MEKELNRNDLCFCGSGKKYKNCHMNKPTAEKANKSFIIIGILIILAVVAALSIFYSLEEDKSVRPANNSNSVNSPAPRPEGEAPEGKVWSSEHGHWHDK